MSDHVYRLSEIVGSSPTSVDDAIRTAIAKASQTVRNIEWFETTEHRVAKAGYPPGTAAQVRAERSERQRIERRSPYRQDGAGSFD